jgi:GTP-binding protein YchF
LKLSLIGLPMAGKSTLFETLTRSNGRQNQKSENRMAVIDVPDDRIDSLKNLYQPRKTTYAKVEYFLPGITMGSAQNTREQRWAGVRDSDAFIHVIQNFRNPGFTDPDPSADCQKIEDELILADLIVAEKRLERLEAEKKKGRDYQAEEHQLILEIYALLETGRPVRSDNRLAGHPLLRGYAFLSAKPKLIIFNNDDEDTKLPDFSENAPASGSLMIRGKLEHEISRMTQKDSEDFLAEYRIHDLARNRVIRKSFELLGLLSFFTVGDDEVKAWTVRKGVSALEAAAEIHSDIQKGFIRAETVSYDDLISAGGYTEARKKGAVRLEGKTYTVQDGDIMNFRFNI